MPKKLSENLTANIEAEIARYPEGVGIDGLHQALAGVVSRRTLQRRLALLVQTGLISPEGEGRALTYRLNPRSPAVPITGGVNVVLEPLAMQA